MIKRLVALLAPDATDASGGAATATVATPAQPSGPTPASAMSGWMTTIKTELPNPSLGSEGAKEQPKEPDGKTGSKPDAAVDKPPAGDTGKSVAANDGSRPADAAPVELPEDKWPRTAQEWKKFKEAGSARVKERDAKIAALEKDLSEAKSKVNGKHTDLPEWKAMEQERNDLSERLRITEVTNHPRFVAYFKNKVDAQVSLAKNIVGTDLAAKVEKLLLAPEGEWRNNQLEEVMLELTPIQSSRFGSVLNAMEQINQERAGEIAKAKESYDLLQKQKEESGKAAMEKHVKTFNDIVGRAQDAKDGMPAYQKRADDDAWNKGVDERINSVRDLLLKGDPASIVQAVLDAKAYPEAMRDAKALREQVEKLEAQVKKLSAATPGFKGDNANAPDASGNGARVEIKHGTRPNEATSQFVETFRQAMNG